MGIGDKQRIERERREKYARAIEQYQPGDEVDRVIALVDAEIEPLLEQIEDDGERIAAQIGRIVGLENEIDRIADTKVATESRLLLRAEAAERQVEALEATIQNAIETLVWLEAEGAEPYEKLRDLLMGTVPEPEYEYALRGKKWTLPSDARFDSLQEVQEWLPRYTRKPEDWIVVRRRAAGEWEDVK